MHELTPEQEAALMQTAERLEQERKAFAQLPKEEQIRIRGEQHQHLLRSLGWGHGLRKFPHPRFWPHYPCMANGLPI